MHSKHPQTAANHLLAALPGEVLRRLEPSLELVDFELGEVIYESGAQLRHAYFPVTCIISLLYTMENGVSAEIGVTGNEGVMGLALYMGGGTMPNRAINQSAGSALRLPAKALQDEFKRGSELWQRDDLELSL